MAQQYAHRRGKPQSLHGQRCVMQRQIRNILNLDNAANLSGSATEGSGIGDGIGRDVVDLERLKTRWTP